jgi:hypothetical protein
MTEATPPTHLLPAWSDFLDRIDQAVQQSLDLAVEPVTAIAPGSRPSATALQSLDDGMTRWQACLDGAVAETEEAATLAATEEAALAVVIQEIRQSREKLARWLKPAV